MSHPPTVRGHVRTVGRGGDAVVETDHGIVLVPGGLPGEEVVLTVSGRDRGATRGRLRSIASAAAERREPPCSEVARCGGCPLMIAEPSLQRQIKEQFLEEACAGLAGAEDAVRHWQSSPNTLAYRSRARLAWRGENLGYRGRDSRTVADIPTCIVLDSELQSAWDVVRTDLAPHLTGQGEVLLTATHGQQSVIEIRSDDTQSPALYAACESVANRSTVAGVAVRIGGASAPATWGETDVHRETLDGVALRMPSVVFAQANDAVNTSLVQYVMSLTEAEGARVLELFSGAGNFSLPLAACAQALVCVEQVPSAAQALQENLAAAGHRAKVVTGDANEPPGGKVDVLLLDPPRQGAKVLFSTHLASLKPSRVVYVSCDPATLGRDLRLAVDQGYRIDHIAGFDMFPQTAHLEAVVRLVRQ